MAFETTTDEVIAGVDLSGTTAVVTGATSGLGLETARVPASAGARVVVCGRTAEKCASSIAAIRRAVPAADISSMPRSVRPRNTPSTRSRCPASGRSRRISWASRSDRDGQRVGGPARVNRVPAGSIAHVAAWPHFPS